MILKYFSLLVGYWVKIRSFPNRGLASIINGTPIFSAVSSNLLRLIENSTNTYSQINLEHYRAGNAPYLRFGKCPNVENTAIAYFIDNSSPHPLHFCRPPLLSAAQPRQCTALFEISKISTQPAYAFQRRTSFRDEFGVKTIAPTAF